MDWSIVGKESNPRVVRRLAAHVLDIGPDGDALADGQQRFAGRESCNRQVSLRRPLDRNHTQRGSVSQSSDLGAAFIAGHVVPRRGSKVGEEDDAGASQFRLPPRRLAQHVFYFGQGGTEFRASVRQFHGRQFVEHVVGREGRIADNDLRRVGH